ncbi:MAG: preprotein translocase subunit YajC [Bauldia sp.]|nr:preprotein translocase subunit YajC [Bauldia sp.]
MFITPAFAQEATTTAASGGSALLLNLLPFVLIFAIMYFLIIRPQRTRMKQHQELVRNVRRGDTIITNGGLIGRVSKVVDDMEVQVEIAEGTRVRLLRSSIAEIRSKTEPVREDTANSN